MKKNILAAAFAGILGFSLAACSSTKNVAKTDVSSGGKITSKNGLTFPLGDDVSARFFGTVYFKNLIQKDSTYNFPVTNNITFAPGSHSGWHVHGGMEVLVTGGRGYYQAEGEKAQIIQKGDVLHIPAGVKHWHGATPDSWFSQIVIYDADWKPESGKDVHEDVSEEWYANVDAEEYNGRKLTSADRFMFGNGTLLSSQNFSGPAYLSDVLETPNEAGAPGIHNVVFDAGTYNAWHTHEGGQILIATDGIGFHQIEGESVQVMHPGDVAFCPPNVRHWHGATANSSFAHLAVNTNPEKTGVQWFGRIPEKEYKKLSASLSSGAVVKTENGLVRGSVSNGIYSFKGIPYAQVEKRFTVGKPVQKWSGIFDATKYGSIAVQTGFCPGTAGTDNMSENPLNLNIWTPAADSKKRAVIVWLHGGGFMAGSAIEQPFYDGENLSKRGDVVVVSVNHRLNVLGHLNLASYSDEYKYSGNVGIYDLVQALQWIKSNIANFGGDKNNVTIFGESGGGAKVLALMESPYANGLFRRGIVESGATETMGVLWTPKAAAERVTELTLENLGLKKDEFEKLQSVPYSDLVQASDKALDQTGKEFKIPAALGEGYSLSWEPYVDGDFIPDDIAGKNGFPKNGEKYSLLIGSNLNEWETMQKMGDASWNSGSKITMGADETKSLLFQKYGEKADEVLAAFKTAYPEKQDFEAAYVDSRVIRIPMLKIMRAKARQKSPVYSYIFALDSPLSVHTAEIPFVFANADMALVKTTDSSAAKKVQDEMSDAWIAFAKNGDPSTVNLKWEAYTNAGGATMIFDENTRLARNHDKKLIQLIAPEYNWE